MQVRNLTVTMKRDLRCLVENLTFTLGPGDKMAIIGEEGNGKSTLLRLLYDPELVEPYVEWSGQIQPDGQRLGLLRQELSPRERAMTVAEYLERLPCFLSSEPRDRAEAAALLRLPGGFFRSEQQIDTLSGGEKVKLQLAGLLLDQPDVLLLDEPSGDLDLNALEFLETFLRETPLPLLFVSHDEMLLERVANGVLHLEQLRRKTRPRCTVAHLPYRDYVQARLGAMRHQDQAARKEREEYACRQARWQQIFEKVQHQQRSISRQDPHGGRLLKKKMKSVKAQQRRLERDGAELAAFPETEEAILPAFPPVSLPQGKRVLELSIPRLETESRLLAENLSLTVTGPEHLCIIGDNGRGKTTLLRRIAGELLERTDLKAAYMPQNYEEVLPREETPVSYLAPDGSKEAVTRARTFLGSMKFTALEMEHPIHGLSGGQKAKLLLLGMILNESNVLLLDEPTRNFSPLSAPMIRQALQSYGGAIISVSHDRNFIASVCSRVLLMEKDGLIPVSETEFCSK